MSTSRSSVPSSGLAARSGIGPASMIPLKSAEGPKDGVHLTSGRGGIYLAVSALALGFGLKIWLIFSETVPFNADEAIVALMARHILQGEWSPFFYGQAYMGSLDALLASLIFSVLGEFVWGIRLLQLALFMGTLATSMFIARRVFGSWTAGTAAGWLLAVPVVTFSLYTTASLGNYGEVLLLGNLIIICSLRIAVQLRADKLANHWLWLVFGLLAGIGFWAFGLILVYIVPAVAYIGYFFIRSAPGQAARNYAVACALSLAGFLAGSMPFWIFILRESPLAAIQELGGSAVSGVEGLGYLGQIFQHVAGFLLFGLTAALGLRPSWEVRWLAIPLLPLAVLFWAGVLTFTIRSIRLDQQRRADLVLLCGVGGTLTLGFILTPFGADPSGRYFLPLVVIAAILAGGFIQFLAAAYSRLAWVLLACVSVFQLWGNLDTALRNPPGITTQFDAVTQIDHSYDQELIDFLNQSGTTRGYSNYWVAYPLAFLSGEEIIFVPRLPYHPDFRYTDRDDRYAPYGEIVASADEIAYITTNHPDLDQKIRQGFSELGVDWSERRIGDYQIFYGLSEPVRPIQIGFGGTTP